jgi:hypothetical protein
MRSALRSLNFRLAPVNAPKRWNRNGIFPGRLFELPFSVDQLEKHLAGIEVGGECISTSLKPGAGNSDHGINTNLSGTVLIPHGRDVLCLRFEP